ncbi:MAG: hypothetical protein ACK4E8_12510 [Lacibacter sp.]|jgi:hypothetical protein
MALLFAGFILTRCAIELPKSKKGIFEIRMKKDFVPFCVPKKVPKKGTRDRLHPDLGGSPD